MNSSPEEQTPPLTLLLRSLAKSLKRVCGFLIGSVADGTPHTLSSIWYPWGSQENKWVFDDGFNELVGHITLHLFREAYWRMSAKWLGPEAPHANKE